MHQTMDEDFSFPTTTDAPPRFIGSPTLWRRSSSVAPVRSEQITDPPSDNSHSISGLRGQRKSFSYAEENNRDPLHSADADGEEIMMDVLWEDFMNEEVSKSCGFLMESDERNTLGHSGYSRKQRSLKLAKGGATGRVVVSGKRPGLLLFLRVMKKLVLFHNYSQPSIKK